MMMMLSKLLLLLWNFYCFTTGLPEMYGSKDVFFRRTNESFASKSEIHLREKRLMNSKFPCKKNKLYLTKLEGRELLSGIQKLCCGD